MKKETIRKRLVDALQKASIYHTELERTRLIIMRGKFEINRSKDFTFGKSIPVVLRGYKFAVQDGIELPDELIKEVSRKIRMMKQKKKLNFNNLKQKRLWKLQSKK